ncbi:MAG: 3-keto-5-aminohexanoate cleavage protein [Fischerella sp.]|nr:3-keto-5-aminohexanoate cleavage protein [Fischerella sp.]
MTEKFSVLLIVGNIRDFGRKTVNGELPLIVQCRCNDADYRKENPELPYSPQEMMGETVRLWEAGASVFHHWRARDLFLVNGAEIVEKIVQMAHILGRKVATPAQAREIFKMPPPPELPTCKQSNSACAIANS